MKQHGQKCTLLIMYTIRTDICYHTTHTSILIFARAHAHSIVIHVLKPTGWCAKQTENQSELSMLSQWQLLILKPEPVGALTAVSWTKTVNKNLPFIKYTALKMASKTRKMKRGWRERLHVTLFFVGVFLFLFFVFQMKPEALWLAAF